jgi:hypothetical protein
MPLPTDLDAVCGVLCSHSRELHLIPGDVLLAPGDPVDQLVLVQEVGEGSGGGQVGVCVSYV